MDCLQEVKKQFSAINSYGLKKIQTSNEPPHNKITSTQPQTALNVYKLFLNGIR